MGASAMSPTRKKSTKKKTTQGKARRKQPRASKASVSKPQEHQLHESDLVLAWFRLLARRRGAWLQHLWMNEGSIDGRATVTHAELAEILANQDSLEAEWEWATKQEPVRAWMAEAEEIQRRLDEFPNSNFQHLARLFGLSPEEVELLKLSASIAFDPQLGRVCAYLQDHSGRTYLTEDLAARLLGLGTAASWPPEMKVFRWELIQRRDAGLGEPKALLCDPQIKDWLRGKRTLDEVLVGAARLFGSDGMILPEWPVDEVAEWISESITNGGAVPLRIIITSPEGGGKRAFASSVAARLNMPLLMVTADNIEEGNWSRFFIHANRQVFLDFSALAWSGEAATQRKWPRIQSTFPVQFVLCEPGSQPPLVSGVVDRIIQLPIPDASTREQLWRQSSTAAGKWPVAERRKLAEQHAVWPGDIQRAAYLGADTPERAALIVRESARARFGNLAQMLECPFTKDDLVLPDAVLQQLEAIMFEAEARPKFWQQAEARRLFPQGRGLITLFSGPSGTGKTMSAQVIAAELNQDLCRVNVAQLVSKWVGDTPKNVEQVIRVAAENDVVLFFDEADALFARRAAEIRDAQDKFANTDTAFLLQAIESFPGVAILATNLKSNIDPAFMRRLRYLVEFPKPDVSLQRKLWTKLVSALAGEHRAKALEPAIESLSTSADVTGAQIKFAVLGGLFAALSEKKELTGRHLLVGLDRELGKEGRGLGTRERDRILRVEEAA